MNARSYWVLLCYFTQIYFQFTSPNCIVILPTNHINVVSGNSNRSALAGPLLRSLHWLPVRQRINFKLAKLCYLVTSFQQPGYLADLISPVQSVSFVAVVHTEVSVSSAAQLGHYCSSFLSCCSKTLELSSSELSNCCIC